MKLVIDNPPKRKGYRRGDNGLTDKQEAFAQGVAVEGLSQAQAYRNAYDTTKASRQTVINNASELARREDVGARIAELKAEIVGGCEDVSGARRDLVLGRLEDIAFDEKVTPSAQIKALELLGKHLGLWVERSEVISTTRNASEVEADLRRALKALGSKAE